MIWSIQLREHSEITQRTPGSQKTQERTREITPERAPERILDLIQDRTLEKLLDWIQDRTLERPLIRTAHAGTHKHSLDIFTPFFTLLHFFNVLYFTFVSWPNSMWAKLHWMACKIYKLQSWLKCNKTNNHITVNRNKKMHKNCNKKMQMRYTIKPIITLQWTAM